MVSIGDKALLFRNRNMMWLEESRSPSIGDKGFLVRTKDANYFLKKTSVSVGNRARIFNINNQYYLRSEISIPGTFNWSYYVGKEIVSKGLVDNDGNIYFGSTQPYGQVSFLTSISRDGTFNWSFSPYWGDFFDIPRLTSDGNTIITTPESGIYSINKNDGSLNWSWITYAGIYGSPLLDSDDNIFVSDYYMGLYKFDINGNLIWHNASFQEMYSEMAISSDNDDLYVHSWSGVQDECEGLIKVNANDGSVVWNNKTAHSPYSTIILDEANGVLYSALFYDFIGSLYLDDGEINWSHRIAINYVGHGLQLTNGDLIYTNEFGGSSSIFSITIDGILNWTRPIVGWIGGYYYGITRDSNNIIYAPTWSVATNSTFYSITSNGEFNDIAYTTAYQQWNGAVLSPTEDAVYFGTGDGYIISLAT